MFCWWTRSQTAGSDTRHLAVRYRVTVFNVVFELLICCGSTPVTKRLHRKCNFNRQLQYLPNEFVIMCWGKSFSGSNLMQLSTKTIDVKKRKKQSEITMHVKTPKNQILSSGKHLYRFVLGSRPKSFSLFRDKMRNSVGRHICQCALACTKHQMPPPKRDYSDAMAHRALSSSLSRNK